MREVRIILLSLFRTLFDSRLYLQEWDPDHRIPIRRLQIRFN